MKNTKKITGIPDDWDKGWDNGYKYAKSGNKKQHPDFPFTKLQGVKNIGQYNSGFAEGILSGYRY